MTQEQLRAEYLRLFLLNETESHFDLINYFNDCLIKIITNHHHDEVNTQVDADAKMILQMMSSKLSHLEILMNGVQIPNSVSTIIDPTIIANSVRNIYEMVCLFNIIYVMPNSVEEKELVYKLWVISSLKYRQMHLKETSSEENKEKLGKDRVEIETLKNEILNSNIYGNLIEHSKNLIIKCIKQKNYKIKFNGNQVEEINWQYPSSAFNSVYSSIYNYFSQYAHPSHASVWQFGQLFVDNENTKMALFNLRLALQLYSFFLADYIKAFPKTLDTFNKLPITQQIALNSFNKGLRGDNYSINDCWKILG